MQTSKTGSEGNEGHPAGADRGLSTGGSRAERAAIVFSRADYRPASGRATGSALERSGPTEQKRLCDEVCQPAEWKTGGESAQDPAFHPYPDRSPAGSGSTDPGTQSASE